MRGNTHTTSACCTVRQDGVWPGTVHAESNNNIDTNKGRRQNCSQKDDKNMLGNIGDLFVKCMRQVTKGHLYHLLGYWITM